ncbi:Alpha-methylacyl-CoA racemase-like protein [Leptotrombidium deliense]|uniref:Alpha-methylacyl-CoA racemase-like protein n=1 Tax=Leptotrombidium deliense TaxID=299467 RepID=A0A443SLU5_9ACAR|nr:Alpha-methylacyl-CoA racemase-like protein [Leptotrombidium deliense]
MALKGLKVIEMVGLAPAPFCGMILADFGASVIRVEKVGKLYKVGETRNKVNDSSFNPDVLKRGKQSIAIELKHKEGQNILKKLSSTADVLLEPFRPGVMEKLNLGPEQLCKLNERLIYARLSGFGQDGTFMKEAGHDINYLAVSGVLSVLGGKSSHPLPPINLMGDFAGGGLICALGICLALIERANSGKGQVIDTSIVEGSNYVSSWLWHSSKSDQPFSKIIWPNLGKRESNLLDGGSPMYTVYETKDNKHMAVGALEPQFYANFLSGLGLNPEEYPEYDVDNYDKMKAVFQKCFKSKTQQEWTEIFDHKNACVTPVVNLKDAKDYKHNASRNSFLTDGTPRPSPLLSRTPASPTLKEPKFAEHTEHVLKEIGYSDDDIRRFVDENIINVAKLTSSL